MVTLFAHQAIAQSGAGVVIHVDTDGNVSINTMQTLTVQGNHPQLSARFQRTADVEVDTVAPVVQAKEASAQDGIGVVHRRYTSLLVRLPMTTDQSVQADLRNHLSHLKSLQNQKLTTVTLKPMV